MGISPIGEEDDGEESKMVRPQNVINGRWRRL
jgi:hypothetical protein